MKNKKITRKLTHGMYVLTTKDGGCMVDAVMQASSGDNPFILVSVMKSNNTCELMNNNNEFCLSVLSESVNGEIIKTFGLNSGRDINKYEVTELIDAEGVPAIKDSIGYIKCEKVNSIDMDSHILFVGKMIEGDLFNDEYPLSYNKYMSNKDEYIKVTVNESETVWVCTVCGYIYHGEEMPEDFKCPVCGVGKEYFKKQN